MSERIIKNAPQLLQKPTSGFYEQPGKHDLEKTHCVQISGSQFHSSPPHFVCYSYRFRCLFYSNVSAVRSEHHRIFRHDSRLK